MTARDDPDYFKKHYQKNREKKIAESRAWQVANKERRQAYMREYYEKNPDKFPRRTPEQRAQYNANRRARYAADEEFREKVKQQSKMDPERRKISRIRAQYGIDGELVADMWELDGCQICHEHPDNNPTLKRHIDHDHRTGLFRGVLCQSCNLALGHMKDDPYIIAAALQYILQSARSVDGCGFIGELMMDD